jgi:arylsulfatase A-like enzyme
MKRRKFIHYLGLATFSITTGTYLSCTQEQNPNVILIVVDDLGWKDLGCYGSSFYETPNVDQLAASGMRFTSAYSACPVCSPTRAALLTGKSPAKLRFTGHITAINRHRFPEHGRIIPPQDKMFISLEEITIAEALKPAGYKTASIGKWHVGNEEKYYPTEQGFDVNIAGYKHGSPPSYYYPYKNPQKEWNPEIPTLIGGEQGEYLTDRLTNEAIRFIEQSQEDPFFLYLPYYTVHTPLEAPSDLIQKYDKKLKTNSTQKNATYAAMVDRMDYNIGRLMQKVGELGLKDKTLIIFTSDNGGLSRVTNNVPLRAGKGYLYEGGIRIPLIIKWPGHIREGSLCDTPVISHDLYPTITNIVNNSLSGGAIEGKSLIPLLKQKHHFQERRLYWYYPHYSPQAKQPAAAVRDGDFKLIQFYDPENIELYNLADDISETNELSQQMPQKVNELSQALSLWLNSVNAKLHRPNPKYKSE